MESHGRLRHRAGMKLVEMEPVVEGLHASAGTPMPFGRELEMRSFLLERATGNLLIYGAPGIRELDDVWRHYLNHWHEAAFAEDTGAPLFVHAADRAEVEGERHVRAAFSRRHMLDDDVEVIPMPGHTPVDRVPVGHRRAPHPLHRRHDLPARRRVGHRGARFQRS